jgi:ribosomal protein S18 acetylase RimI-like enzyme
MNIVDYDNADPFGVLYLNLISLGYALTPERVALIRHLDPRPFPFFAIYAIDDGIVAGQVGVYRLPMVTIEGPEDVGGICAVCTHPAFGRRGLAARLLDEAHTRMRAAGLRFSTLGTNRYRTAYGLYQRQGYVDVFAPTSTVIRRDDVRYDAHIHAEPADSKGLRLSDALFRQVAAGRLGFARRHGGFLPMMVATGEIGADEVWLLRNDDELIGYALARGGDSVLKVSSLQLVAGADAATAVASLARDLQVSYIQVRVDQSSVAAGLHHAGFPPAQPTWDTFMIKPLFPEFTAESLCHLFGIGTERFIVSRIDVT